MKRNIHVVPRGKGWAVYREGDKKAARIYQAQGLAAERAKVEAMQSAGQVVIHGQDGKVLGKSSYASSPG